jgi:hypothetical protein
MEEVIRPDGRNEYIGPTIVIIIPNRNSHAIGAVAFYGGRSDRWPGRTHGENEERLRKHNLEHIRPGNAKGIFDHESLLSSHLDISGPETCNFGRIEEGALADGSRFIAAPSAEREMTTPEFCVTHARFVFGTIPFLEMTGNFGD